MAEGGGDEVDSGRRRDHYNQRMEDTETSISLLSLGSESLEPVLCREHSQEFKYFCKSHMTELCITCRRMEHKNCKTVIDIEEAAEDIYSKTHGEKIIKSVRELSERFKECKAAIEEIKNMMPNKRKVALDNVKHTRKLIDDYLNELEANAVAEVDRLFKEEIKVIEE